MVVGALVVVVAVVANGSKLTIRSQDESNAAKTHTNSKTLIKKESFFTLGTHSVFSYSINEKADVVK